MRWKVIPATTEVPEYDPFVFTWASATTRLYTTRLGATKGTVSSTAPAVASSALSFDIPSYADLFGLQLVATVNSGTASAFALAKIEAFAVGEGEDETDFTFALDSGRLEEPYIWYGGGASGVAATTSQIISRQFLDISSGDANINGVEFLRESGTAIKRNTIWFSPFGAHAGLPYVGNYRRIYIVLSAQPAATTTVQHTLKIRPIAIKVSDASLATR